MNRGSEAMAYSYQTTGFDGLAMAELELVAESKEAGTSPKPEYEIWWHG